MLLFTCLLYTSILTEISGGRYAVAVARVVGDDFAKPWYQFFNSLLQDSAYEMLPKPCFEVYLNNGAEDGYWDIEMYVACLLYTSRCV